MTSFIARWAASLLALAGVAAGQGVLSYVDTGAPPYHVELIDMTAFEACRGEPLERCDARATVAYRLPFQLESQADAAMRDIDDAWQRFYDRVVETVHAKLNMLPPCWNPLASCGAHVNWACVSQRQLEAVIEAFATYQPLYWADVVTALGANLPLSLWWEGVLPLQEGAVVAAISTLVPKPGQVTALLREPRDAAYYFQPPLFPGLGVPYAPGELDLPERPGLVEKEEAKRALERATVPEYAQFGFTSFWQAWGDVEDTLFMRWDPLPKPSLVASICLIQTPPYIAIIPFIPVPTFVPRVPKAFYGYQSVPEGYRVPRLAGRPLFELPDLETLIPSTSARPVARLQAMEAAEPVPCLPRGAPWPPPGHGSAHATRPAPCPPGTPLPPQYQAP